MFHLQVLVLGSLVALGVLATFESTTSAADPDAEFLFYDFWSKGVPRTVKNRFRNVKVIKSLKAYGVGRYLFLVENDQSRALKDLELPWDAENIRVFSVEHLFTFFSHFSVNWHTPNIIHQDDQNLTFVERTWSPSMTTQEEFSDALANQASKVPPRSKNQIFVATAGLPVKFFFFMNKSDYNTTELLLKHTSALGGPRDLKIHTVKVFNI